MVTIWQIQKFINGRRGHTKIQVNGFHCLIYLFWTKNTKNSNKLQLRWCLFCLCVCFVFIFVFFCIEYNIYPQITQHVCEVRLHFRCPDRCYSSILFGTASFDGSEINWCYLWYHIAEVKGSVIWSRGRTSNWN